MVGRMLLAVLLWGWGLGNVSHAADSTAVEPQAEGASSYAVVVSQASLSDPAWREVVDALVAKHQAQVVEYADTVDSSLDSLRRSMPRFTCFVAKPEEATRAFVANVHQLTRRLDDDPYTDTLWGILTGYDAENALAIARRAEPLTIQRVAAGTEVALEMCEEGVWYCELQKNRMVRKRPGGEAETLVGPDDTTQPLVETLTEYHADLVVTSGHATERDWQIGFRYRNGYFRCEQGELYGLDTAGQRHPIRSANPKVYLPVGNCLMGHVDSRDAMALAWMHSAGVHQMIGYTVPTWYGYGGWGMLDYFVEQPGRFTAAEAFFANQQALLHRLESCQPGLSASQEELSASRLRELAKSPSARQIGLSQNDLRGLLFDRDVVAFYGDPAWRASMAVRPSGWEQTLTEQDGLYVLTIQPLRGAQSFDTVNQNGSQRGGRPLIQLLPHRIQDVVLLEGAELHPVVTDNFVLVPRPVDGDPGRLQRVVFRATPLP